MDHETARNRTVWCGNLSEKISEIILYELFLQAGPIEDIHIPKDKDGRKRNFAFVIYKHLESVPYAIELLNGINLYGKPLKLDGREGNKLNDNPYRLALIRHHRKDSHERSISSSERPPERSERSSPRVSHSHSHTGSLGAIWPPQSPPTWATVASQNGPNVRLPPGMSRFSPGGLSFQMSQMTSFMSGSAAPGGFPQLTPAQMFMLGAGAGAANPPAMFPWQAAAAAGLPSLSPSQLGSLGLPQEQWPFNQRRF